MAPVVSQPAPIESPTVPSPAPAFQEPLAPLSYPEPAPMAQESAAVPTAPVLTEEEQTATLANGKPAVFRPMEDTATDATNGSVDVPAAPQHQ